MDSEPTPNYVNPVSIGYRVTDAAIVTVVFAVIFVVVRLLTKTLVTRHVGLDDCMNSPSADYLPLLTTLVQTPRF